MKSILEQLKEILNLEDSESLVDEKGNIIDLTKIENGQKLGKTTVVKINSKKEFYKQLFGKESVNIKDIEALDETLKGIVTFVRDSVSKNLNEEIQNKNLL